MEVISERITALRAEACLEKRFYPRFEVLDGAIASLNHTVIGQIINISQNGLIFRYVARSDNWMELSTLDISTSDRTFNLGMIPIKVVRDVATPGSFFSDAISLRYCCVEFGVLEDYQIVALRYFIQNHTIADPEA